MSDFAIRYEVGGVAKVEHVLLGIRDRALNAAPVLAVILEDMRRLENELFETEGHGEWPALSQTTLEEKAREGYPPKILQATEALKDSLTGNLSAMGHVERITEEEVVFGTTIPYAKYHQEGRGVPQRAPVDLREENVRGWTKQIQQYILGVDRMEIAAAGGSEISFGMASLDPFGL